MHKRNYFSNTVPGSIRRIQSVGSHPSLNRLNQRRRLHEIRASSRQSSRSYTAQPKSISSPVHVNPSTPKYRSRSVRSGSGSLGPERRGRPNQGRDRKTNPFRVIVKIRPESDDRVPLSLERVDGKNIQIRDHKRSREYSFDLVTDPLVSQEDFFRKCGIIPLLNSAFAGYSAAVFAYGQTGSGKTYTMTGPIELASIASTISQSSGLMQRAAEFICNMALEQNFTIQAGYIEIYNEQVHDLLDLSSGVLGIRGDISNGFFVERQLFVECEDIKDLMAVLQEGNKNRSISSHELNCDSSRSHCIFTVKINGQKDSILKKGRISFVDLAGSEKLRDSKSETKKSIRETGNINRSLFVLGEVISKLSKLHSSNYTNQSSFHIPYRDSVLTKLLRHCLGGDALVLMIATVTPALRFAEESISTLNYATNAINIKNKPISRQFNRSKDSIIQTLRDEIRHLKGNPSRRDSPETRENEMLREELRKLKMENQKLKEALSSEKKKKLMKTSDRRSSSHTPVRSQIRRHVSAPTPPLSPHSFSTRIAEESSHNSSIEKLKYENEKLHRRISVLEQIFVQSGGSPLGMKT